MPGARRRARTLMPLKEIARFGGMVGSRDFGDSTAGVHQIG